MTPEQINTLVDLFDWDYDDLEFFCSDYAIGGFDKFDKFIQVVNHELLEQIDCAKQLLDKLEEELGFNDSAHRVFNKLVKESKFKR
jgi:hypothetical protein